MGIVEGESSLSRPEEMAYLVQAVRMCITVALVVLTNRRQSVPARTWRRYLHEGESTSGDYGA